MRPIVFNFTHPREYLLAVHGYQKERNPSFSLRAWAKKLGYKSSSYLNEMVNGHKPISIDLAGRVALQLDLPFKERKCLELLVLRETVQGQERVIFQELLDTVVPEQETKDLSVDEFRLVADWYHFVLMEMAELKDFKEDHNILSQRLGESVSPELVKVALERLIRLDLLKRDKNGKLRRTKALFNVSSKIPNSAIRIHHRQMLEKAILALENQKVNERFFSGCTIAVDQDEVQKVEGIIEDFQKKLCALLQGKDRRFDSVYRVGIQVFKAVEF